MIAEKRNRKQRRNWILGLGMMLLLSIGVITVDLLTPNQEIPVFNEKMVIRLPEIKIEEETIRLPYNQGEVVVDYFTGISSEIPTVVEFEGIYRPSQGVDIVWQQEAFDVVAALSGEVVEVNQDALLGESIAIRSQEWIFIYQSLSDIQFKKGDFVKQGELLGKAGKNVYQSSLKNHLHLVVEKEGKIVDPNTIFNFK